MVASLAIAGASPTARARFARAGSRASSATSPVGACSASLARAVAAPGRATLASAPRGRAARLVRAAEGDEGAGAAQGGEQESALAFEPKSKSKRKRRDGSKTRRAKITVEGAAIEAARGEATPTIQSASEEAYILFLFAYVVVIFLGGLVLAVSAFGILPDKLDSWVTETLYPSYSPIVIGFLVFSSIYGLVKTRDDPNSAVGK